MNLESPDKNRRVLVIDDNRAIHDDFRKILAPADATTAALDATEAALFGGSQAAVPSAQFEVDSAFQGQEGVLMVKKAMAAGRPYAMAFVDVRMPPGWDGVETTRKMWELDTDLQVVLCTAYSDYTWSEMFERLGRRDGLLILKKPFDSVEAFQLANALTEKWWLHQQFQRKMEELETRVAERTCELQQTNHALQTEVLEHQRARGELRESEAKYRGLFENAVEGIYRSTPGGSYLAVNDALASMYGYGRPAEMMAEVSNIQSQIYVDPAFRERFKQKIESAGIVHGLEYQVRRRDGSILWISESARAIRSPDGTASYYEGFIQDITVRKQTENALRESNEKFQQLADNITDVFWVRSPDLSEVQYVSPGFERIWGRSVASLIANPQQWADFILPEDRERVLAAFAELKGDVPSLDIEYRIARPDGEVRWVRARGFQVRNAAQKLIRHTGIINDITERKKLEVHLLQSQKLETVGKLAGGIAHEFNSILTAIIGHSDLLLSDLPKGSSFAKNAGEINRAASRAAKLTQQLLAYGRKQFLQPEVLDLNRIIASMDVILHSLMGEKVDMNVVPAPGLHAVRADAGQIEQVIMNMAVNARDSMPNGGKLTIETANVSFGQESVGHFPELKAGDYVMLAITDTGAGMSEQVKARVFEPFFTTKAVGEGTGLGLSTCYGIIKQSGGDISVYSELRRGTTFKIYLPQAAQQAKISSPRADPHDLPRGTESILLVEDDPALLELAATLLRRLGYTVSAASNGIEALSLRQQNDAGHFDLLFTDVVMPHMSGKELADRVRALYPLTRILFTSSSTENAIVQQGVLDKGVALLQKPFTPSALARKVRAVLDLASAPEADHIKQTD